MEINVNFVLFEELKKKPEGGLETRIVIVRQSKDTSSAFDSDAADLDLGE